MQEKAGKGKYNRAAIILIKNSKILLIHRIKNKKEYYVAPGGKIEKNETKEETAIREAKEETNLDVAIKSVFLRVNDNYHNGIYYLVEEQKKGQKIRVVGPEKTLTTKKSYFKPEWVKMERINKMTIYPKELKEKLLEIDKENTMQTRKISKKAEITAKEIIMLILIIAFFIAAFLAIKIKLGQILR